MRYCIETYPGMISITSIDKQTMRDPLMVSNLPLMMRHMITKKVKEESKSRIKRLKISTSCTSLFMTKMEESRMN
jgi:hypothetical protein